MATQTLSTPTTATTQKLRTQRIVGLVVLQLFMTICVISFLAPTFWMLSSSLKASTEVFQHPIKWIPESPQWSNYVEIFSKLPFGRFAWNTFFVVVLAVIGTVLSSAIVAFGFARINFPGRRILFGLMIATMMLPEIVTLIPRFILFKNLPWLGQAGFQPPPPDSLLPWIANKSWIDSPLPLILPFWFATTSLYVFLLYQFFRGIPHELDEAAIMDGASRWTVLTKVMLPLSKPVLATVAVFSLIQHYNEFLTPLIYLNKIQNWVMSLGIRALNDSNVANWELVFAASTLMLIPVLVLFIIAQRYFVQGIALTGFGGR
jgi:ABC-type glycerol-3-phosphate transport system permease component